MNCVPTETKAPCGHLVLVIEKLQEAGRPQGPPLLYTEASIAQTNEFFQYDYRMVIMPLRTLLLSPGAQGDFKGVAGADVEAFGAGDGRTSLFKENAKEAQTWFVRGDSEQFNFTLVGTIGGKFLFDNRGSETFGYHETIERAFGHFSGTPVDSGS